jgi:hypothetical protein
MESISCVQGRYRPTAAGEITFQQLFRCLAISPIRPRSYHCQGPNSGRVCQRRRDNAVASAAAAGPGPHQVYISMNESAMKVSSQISYQLSEVTKCRGGAGWLRLLHMALGVHAYGCRARSSVQPCREGRTTVRAHRNLDDEQRLTRVRVMIAISPVPACVGHGKLPVARAAHGLPQVMNPLALPCHVLPIQFVSFQPCSVTLLAPPFKFRMKFHMLPCVLFLDTSDLLLKLMPHLIFLAKIFLKSDPCIQRQRE